MSGRSPFSSSQPTIPTIRSDCVHDREDAFVRGPEPRLGEPGLELDQRRPRQRIPRPAGLEVHRARVEPLDLVMAHGAKTDLASDEHDSSVGLMPRRPGGWYAGQCPYTAAS